MMHLTFGTPPSLRGPTHRGRLRASTAPGALILLFLLPFLAGCGASEGQTQSVSSPSSATAPSPTETQERLPPPGHAWVIFGADTVTAEVARTPEEREQGLMYRENLPEGQGMLFVFPDSQVRSFWMKNTFIPLDIAYLDENLRVVDVQAMQPETEETHPSAGAAMFALEVPLGWYEKEGIGVGAQARLVFGPG